MERVLILASTRSYRADDFARAAAKLGVEPVLGTDRCHKLAEIWDREQFGGSVPIELRDTVDAARAVVAEARSRRYAALVATDDATAEVAALAARELGLDGNSPEAARAARNKRLLGEALHRAGVAAPPFQVFDESERGDEVARRVPHPCVLKPLLCSASRGVMRADDERGFTTMWNRLVALLHTPALRAVEDPDGHRILVQPFVPGAEVAVEGILSDGKLTVLALFDKPDPLDGPFFEETIYVTPSRHPLELQHSVAQLTARAAAAIGLTVGPVHAELRLSPSGPVVLEVAARSIGGLCARTLRFGLGERSLEEVVLRNALGRPLGEVDYFERPLEPSGVMMIPIPRGGVFQGAHGVEEARAVPLVEDVVLSAKPGQVLVPLPEGHAYLGFLFARGPSPAAVEDALRRAHRALRFDVTTTLTPPHDD